MATKAQLFRYLVERSHPKREKRTRGAPKLHHRPTLVESRAAYVLEDSTSGRPSRKSTRRGKHRQKTESQLARRQMRKVRSPEERAVRAVVAHAS